MGLVALIVFTLVAVVVRLVVANPGSFLEQAQDNGRFVREPSDRPVATSIGGQMPTTAANEQRRAA